MYVVQLKDSTWQVVCFVDYHKPNIRAESVPEYLWQYSFPTEPTWRDVLLIVKMQELAKLIKEDFISEYRDCDFNPSISIEDGKTYDGFKPLDDYVFRIRESYRNDCDPCSHFTDAQTAFNKEISEQLLADFIREYPHLSMDGNEFSEWESEAFESSQLIVEIKLKDETVTIRCCVDYGRKAPYTGKAIVDILFEFQPDFLTTNENILAKMKELMSCR